MASSSRFEALFDAAVDAVIVIDDTGRIEAVNPATERLFGYPAAALVGRKVNDLMPEPMASEHDAYMRRYLEEGSPHIIGIGREVVCRRSDSSLFPADLAVGEGGSGEHRFFVGILRDLSERRRLEESLLHREAELRVIFDHSLLATAVINEEGEFLEVNPACQELSGYSPEELLGSCFERLALPEEVEHLAKQLRRALGGRRATFLHRCQRRDGGVRTGLLHMSPLPRSDEGEARVLIQFVDETDRVEAERRLSENRERLAEVSRLSVLGEMAAGIAHEVNQPLGAIANYAEACRIRLGGEGPPEILDLLSKISSQSQRAGEVIRRLRGAARGQEARATELDVNKLVEDAIKLAGLDARFVGVQVVTELSEELPAAFADRVAVQQVLLNLLRNAVEATSEVGGGRVILRTAADTGGGGVLISVEDQGPGISEEVGRRIMHPFFTTKATGMGVGLALCQTLLRANDGKLWYENNDPAGESGERGATFFVLLPLAPAHGASAAAAALSGQGIKERRHHDE